MNVRTRNRSGMTLIEMLAAVTVLMILTAILAQVFYQATRASSRGKGLAEIYQVARALKALMTRDLSGATPDAFVSGENGFALMPIPKDSLPPGPYNSAQYGLDSGGGNPTTIDAQMRRMLLGGSDYIGFTSANAARRDKTVAKVFYVLRASGELVRVVSDDTVFTTMDYRYDAVANGINPVTDFVKMNTYEQQRTVAQNIQRLKFSFLDRGEGPSSGGEKSNQGVWTDSWEWVSGHQYLPAAVKVEIQIVDHTWKVTDDDVITNRAFDPVKMDDDVIVNATGAPGSDGNPDRPEAGEMFDPDDGEAFTFIVDVPLGMNRVGG